MSDAAENQAVPAGDTLEPTPLPKRRGRPAGSKTSAAPKAKVEKKPESTRQQIERIEAQLLKLKEAKKSEDKERNLIVGRVEVARALADDNYRKDLSARLRKEITSKTELTIIAELLD